MLVCYYCAHMKDISKGVVFIGIFLVPFISLYVANQMFFPFITGKNFAFRIIVEIIFAAWIILALYEPLYRPKFSWIVTGFASLIGVMAVANALGEYPLKSFWSNFERMEGYVTLVHVFLYLIVVGSVLTTEKLWNRFFNTTILSAVILSFYAFAQLSGNIIINQGGWRLDGTLGNSAYMAIYMLFHIFITALMFVRTESRNLKFFYAGLIALFVFLLIQTATRGTILGLVGGSFITTIYIALFAKSSNLVKRVAVGGIISLVVIVGLFVTFKESEFIQGNPYLQRFSTISLSEAEVRFSIWGMAFEGVKERPLLGWGQGNYNYIFNTYYKPSLYGQEPWFDRVHNIVMDWLIAGGILGLLAYFSILIASLYYLFWQPLFKKDKETFSVVERGILIGLLAGYFFHNILVFDNIISYIFYGSILAFIHSRVATQIPQVQKFKLNGSVVGQVVTPIVAVILIVSVYAINIPGIRASQDIINAFRSPTAEIMIAEFEKALGRNSFADQEIREQLTRQTQNILRSPEVSDETKQVMFRKTESELLKQIQEKPGDARVHVFLSSFYRSTGNLKQAEEQLNIARKLSPKKQQILFEFGLMKLQQGNHKEALEVLKEAYELDTNFVTARIYYVAAGFYAGQPELADQLLNTESLRNDFISNDVAVQAVYAAKEFGLLQEMFESRVEKNPTDPQLRVNLAVSYAESGDVQKGVEILEQAIVDIPSFKEQGEGFIANLKQGLR